VARDIMADAMLRVEKDGYPVVLTVHDSIMSEVTPQRIEQGSESWPSHSLGHFVARMTLVPEWAKGLPIAAEGWEGDRWLGQ